MQTRFCFFIVTILAALVGTSNAATCPCPAELRAPRLVVFNAPGGQNYPLVEVDTKRGNYFVSWTQVGPTPLGGARLLNPNGNKIGPVLYFQTQQPNMKAVDGGPSIAYDSLLDRFLAVWGVGLTDQQTQQSHSELRGRFVSSSGQFEGDPFVISQGFGNGRILFNQVMGQFLLFYSRGNFTDTTTTHFLQRLTKDGVKVGPAVAVNTQKPFSNWTAFALDPNTGTSIVAWENQPTPAGGPILCEVFSRTLQRFGKNRTLSTSDADGPVAAVYDNVRNAFVVFWNKALSATVQARVVTLRGILPGSIVNIQARGTESVAHNNVDGGFLLQFASSTLQAVRIQQDFQVQDRFTPSCQSPDRFGSFSATAFNPLQNEYLSTWSFSDPSPLDSDIYAQRIKGTSTGSCQ